MSRRSRRTEVNLPRVAHRNPIVASPQGGRYDLAIGAAAGRRRRRRSTRRRRPAARLRPPATKPPARARCPPDRRLRTGCASRGATGVGTVRRSKPPIGEIEVRVLRPQLIAVRIDAIVRSARGPLPLELGAEPRVRDAAGCAQPRQGSAARSGRRRQSPENPASPGEAIALPAGVKTIASPARAVWPSRSRAGRQATIRRRPRAAAPANRASTRAHSGS